MPIIRPIIDVNKNNFDTGVAGGQTIYFGANPGDVSYIYPTFTGGGLLYLGDIFVIDTAQNFVRVINAKLGINTATPTTWAHITGDNPINSPMRISAATGLLNSIDFHYSNTNEVAKIGLATIANQPFSGANAGDMFIVLPTSRGLHIGNTVSGDVFYFDTNAKRLSFITGATNSSAFHIGENIGEGGYIHSTNDSQLGLAAGMEFLSGSWIARATSASLINNSFGRVVFFADTGLTDGDAFSPTSVFSIYEDKGIKVGSGGMPSALIDTIDNKFTHTFSTNSEAQMLAQTGMRTGDGLYYDSLRVFDGSKWQAQKGKNVVIVNNVNDLPAGHTLEAGKIYDFNENTIISSSPIFLNGTAFSKIINGNFIYTGTGAAIRLVAQSPYVRSIDTFGVQASNANGDIYEVSATGLGISSPFILDFVSTDRFDGVNHGAKNIGTIENVLVLMRTNQYLQVEGGLEINNNIAGIDIKTLKIDFVTGATGTLLTINGATSSWIQISGYIPIIDTDQKGIYFNPATIFSGIVWTDSIPDLQGAATKNDIFQAGSLDSKSVGATIRNVKYVPDSKAFHTSKRINNIESTTIPALDTPVPITIQIEEVESERIVLQHKLEYNTQTVNFTVGQVVTGQTSLAYGTIVADDDAGTTGTLTLESVSPSLYFQKTETITDPLGGDAILGNIYPVFKYIGIEDTTLTIDNYFAIDPSSSAAATFSIVNCLNGTPDTPGVTQAIAGGTTETIRTIISFQVVTNDQICVNIERNAGAGNIVATQGRIIIHD